MPNLSLAAKFSNENSAGFFDFRGDFLRLFGLWWKLIVSHRTYQRHDGPYNWGKGASSLGSDPLIRPQE